MQNKIQNEFQETKTNLVSTLLKFSERQASFDIPNNLFNLQNILILCILPIMFLMQNETDLKYEQTMQSEYFSNICVHISKLHNNQVNKNSGMDLISENKICCYNGYSYRYVVDVSMNHKMQIFQRCFSLFVNFFDSLPI